MATLTTHVLNIATGIPAAGMHIELRALAAGIAPVLAAVETNADGRCAAPLLQGAAFRSGRYQLSFHVAAYFRAVGATLPEPPFLEVVEIAFGVADARHSYHVPLLVSPWSYSTYRGS